MKRGSPVVSLALASGARGPRFDPRSRRGKFQCPNTLSLVSFAGMTLESASSFRSGRYLDVLDVLMSTSGCCRVHPLKLKGKSSPVQVKEP